MNVNNGVFQNFISLGWYCGTASSMGKHGLRNFSYPFDWISSLSFEGVIHQIETDFSDFLVWQNLELVSEKVFRDVKYNMIFPHDIEVSLYKDYEKICNKYQRRVERFKNSIKMPTCFIRAVFDDKEAEYIQSNYKNIKRVVKLQNPENELVFLLCAESKKIMDIAHCYTLDINEWKNDWDSLRGLFDSRKDFLEYCRTHLDTHSYRQNLEFDSNKCIKREEELNLKEKVMKMKREGNCGGLSGIHEGIIIFGTGFYGKEMTEIFLSHSIPVIAYVDNDENKWNTVQDGIPVLKPDNLKDVKGTVLIAVSKSEDAIIKQLKSLNNHELRWIRLREILSGIM